MTTDESVLVEELRAQLGEVKRVSVFICAHCESVIILRLLCCVDVWQLRDEAAMRHAAELKDALTSMQHQDSVEVMSLTARLQKEQDKLAEHILCVCV